MLAIEGLRHDIGGRTVLRVERWEVSASEPALVLGPSGSGKSTLLNVIAGLIEPTTGEVRLQGRALTAMRPAERDRFRGQRIGLVPQRLHLIEVISVRDNLRLARRLAGLPADDHRIDAVLASLGISSLAGARPANLSVGEAQRVAVGRAVLNQPAIVLADEPTSALDDLNCERVITLLLDQARSCGAALVVATHDQRIAGRFDRQLRL